MANPFNLDQDLINAVRDAAKGPAIPTHLEQHKGVILGKRPEDVPVTEKKNLEEVANTNKALDNRANKAMTKALAVSTNPGYGYHGVASRVYGEKGVKDRYATVHAKVMKHAGASHQEAIHYLDSVHGRHLEGHENNDKYIRKDYKTWKKTYDPKQFA